MLQPAFYVVLAAAGGALLLAWLYFRRFAITRPPVGRINLLDTFVMLAIIVLIPHLYLALPLWLVAVLISLTMLAVVYSTIEPMVRSSALRWALALLLIGIDIAAALQFGTANNVFAAINNVVMIVCTVGIANLWAQSGLRARDLIMMVNTLAIFDYMATTQTSLMHDLVEHLAHLPFMPLVAWDLGLPSGLAGGLGDLLIGATGPIVMRRAFGRSAGWTALLANVAIISTMLVLLATGTLQIMIPAMVLFAPALTIQYFYWRRRGRERTTRQYLEAEPLTDSPASVSA